MKDFVDRNEAFGLNVFCLRRFDGLLALSLHETLLYHSPL